MMPSLKQLTMDRKNILVLIIGDHVETWGNLKKVCDVHKWSYWTLSKKEFPIIHDGWVIHKVPFNETNIKIKSDD